MTSDGAHDPDQADQTRESAQTGDHQPIGEVIDAQIVDSEVVETGNTPGTPYAGSPAHTDPDYTEQGVPSFDFVRDKIEKRISTAIGSQELAEATSEGRGVDEMMRARDEAARKKLEEIRKSMGS